MLGGSTHTELQAWRAKSKEYLFAADVEDTPDTTIHRQHTEYMFFLPQIIMVFIYSDARDNLRYWLHRLGIGCSCGRS